MRAWRWFFLSMMCGYAGAADFDLSSTLRKLEDRYNNLKTMQVEFTQTLSYTMQPAAKRTESGVLYLKKPGRMRWDYREPNKKMFLSDGKDIYFYSSSQNRVEKSKLKETEDMRAPLAFLIGRLDFQRDFKEYVVRVEGQDRWITAKPRSGKAPYTEVRFLLTPGLQIARLRVMGHDQSVMEFRFDHEQLNPKLDDKMFQFHPPAGAEIVDVTN
ncbi:MAG: outer membrane lipoprotein chaperone LolA [Acidobacteria bacterium]|nr:outer membrane lipoprotein chaperone LolA [Acidobacteriota bacterium]